MIILNRNMRIMQGYIKTEDFYKDISNDVKEQYDTSKYDENDKRPLPTGKKVIGIFKDELGGKILMEFLVLRAKAYAYLMEDDTEHKKAKGTNKCIIKRELIFENYRESLFNNEILLKSQQRFKIDHHIVYTEEVNKIVVMMIKDYKHLIELRHIHMVQMLLKYVKVKC